MPLPTWKYPDKRTYDLAYEIETYTSQGAAFLRSLQTNELARYAKVIAEPRPELSFGPPPNLLSASLEDIEAWLKAIWLSTEYHEEPDMVPPMPYEDWLTHCAEDPFYYQNFHARYYRTQVPDARRQQDPQP